MFGTYREPLCSVEVVKMLVDQAGVLLQEVTVQRLHNKCDGVTVKMVADVRRERFRGDEVEELSTGFRIVMGTGCA